MKSFTFAVTSAHCFQPCTITVVAPQATRVVLFTPSGAQVGAGTTGAAGTGGFGTWRVEITATATGYAWTWTT